MKNLQSRMLVFLLLPTLLFFIGMVAYVSTTVYDMAHTSAEETLEAHGESLAGDIQLELEKNLRAVETISHSFEGMIEDGESPAREEANAALRKLLSENATVLTAWMFWEEDAFDGKDEEFVNVEGHDETGRFLPVWSMTEGDAFLVEPVIGYDDTNDDTHHNLHHVLETGESSIFEPFLYEVNGTDELITSIAVPVIVDGTTVGMTGVDIALESLHQYVSDFSFYDTGFAGLLSNEGKVISHQDDSLLDTVYFESSMENESAGDAVSAAVQTGEVANIESFSNTLEKEVYQLFTPVTIDGVSTPWSAFVTAPMNEVAEDARNLTITIVMVSAVVIIVLAVIIFMVTRNIVKPIRQSVEHGKEMAAGDFSRSMRNKNMNRQDEIGDLTRIFASIGENMRELIGSVQDSTERLAESSVSMDEGAKQSTAAANEVASSIEEVSRSSENQLQGAEGNAKSMEEMTQGVQRVADTASTVSDAANEMNKTAQSGQETVQQAIQQMGRIQNETQESKTVIQQLQTGAGKIGSIVSVITDISEQTNLLALNAAIEAARAGESGKGFAVVADEVRKLADETKDSAANISQLIDGIQSDTNQASDFMNTNATEVDKGIDSIEEVGQSFDQITNTIQRVVTEIEGLSAVAEEMSAVSEEISAESQQIASSTEASSGHAQQVAAAAEQQLASMEEMTETSKSLNAMAQELREMLNRFKV
ncbi:methyl-accepting chemotaxis protein [Alteribacillus iranensis]|uniref:Methyl-accepting chemotaxis sensory transducer with Cache sensor n=1 Tax=Alteribacillus iranensis TaxID=930128 RepID=A0A1I2B7Z7_9BACI|nr:methyl-accepting chemotaxis protein [Alteribacillus iranensis]SFE52271.1 methyl-accepting chemotaxis sensory transducer with Cache sensor [Alteribacillus iranensis]